MKLNNLDLNKLHVFAAVAEHGGVGARGGAARAHAVGGEPERLGARARARREALRPRRQAPGADARRAGCCTRICASTTAALQRTRRRAGRRDRRGARPGARRRLSRLPAPAPGGVPRALRAPATRKVRLRVVYAPQEDLNARLLRNRLDFAFALRPRADGARASRIDAAVRGGAGAGRRAGASSGAASASTRSPRRRSSTTTRAIR